jgi:hypothetical protein
MSTRKGYSVYRSKVSNRLVLQRIMFYGRKVPEIVHRYRVRNMGVLRKAAGR